MKFTLGKWGLAALIVGTLAGCGGGGGGGDGTTTAAGTTGGAGGAAVAVAPPAGPVVNAATLTSTEFAALAPTGAVTSVAINSPPVVTFQVTDSSGRGIAGLGFTSKKATDTVASYQNLAFTFAKLVPGTNGSPSKWVNYLVKSPATTTAASAPRRPSWESFGTLVDNGDGTYKYTFFTDITTVKDFVAAATLTAPNVAADLGDLTYDPSLLHRLVIRVGGNARGTGTNTADGSNSGVTAVPMGTQKNIVFDWYPATGEVVGAAGDADGRDIVKVSACFECHQKFTFHGGGMQDTRFCVTCHTDQRRYGRTEATISGSAFSGSTYKVDDRTIGIYPNYIHKIHMGKELTKTGYNYAGVQFNEIGFPQDIRNCTKCHDGSATAANKTPQGDNWKNVPNRLACGSCHDGINFTTGKGLTLADHFAGLTTSTYGHIGGIQTDDSKCALCHAPAAIAVYHTPVTAPNTKSGLHVAGGSNYTNVAWVAGNQNNLPEGAIKVTYDISSVSKNASKNPVMVFRLLQNGTAVAFNDKTAKTEIWDNFIGSPSLYFVFAVPQDGITAPADFNASVSSYLRSLWNGTATGTGAGTLTGPDSSGYYTATLTGSTIPDSAVMLTGGIGYSYSPASTLPLTQTNLADYPVSAAPTDATKTVGGLLVVAPNVTKAATGYTGRRAIVENARCNKCHERLNVFTAKTIHVGQRNDGPSCSWCHTPNRVNSGWSVDSGYYIHAIHAAKKRGKPFTYYAESTTESFANVAFPGILKNCETCHAAGTYDFSASASASALPNRLYKTVAAGIYNGTAGTVTTGTTTTQTALGVFRMSPYVTADNATDYGKGFSYNVSTGVTTAAAGTTLVNSPIANSCFSCHDSDLAMAHMRSNGGSLYAARTTALATSEQCTLCHLAGKVADIKAMHAK